MSEFPFMVSVDEEEIQKGERESKEETKNRKHKEIENKESGSIIDGHEVEEDDEPNSVNWWRYPARGTSNEVKVIFPPSNPQVGLFQKIFEEEKRLKPSDEDGKDLTDFSSKVLEEDRDPKLLSALNLRPLIIVQFPDLERCSISLFPDVWKWHLFQQEEKKSSSDSYWVRLSESLMSLSMYFSQRHVASSTTTVNTSTGTANTNPTTTVAVAVTASAPKIATATTTTSSTTPIVVTTLSTSSLTTTVKAKPSRRAQILEIHNVISDLRTNLKLTEISSSSGQNDYQELRKLVSKVTEKVGRLMKQLLRDLQFCTRHERHYIILNVIRISKFMLLAKFSIDIDIRLDAGRDLNNSEFWINSTLFGQKFQIRRKDRLLAVFFGLIVAFLFLILPIWVVIQEKTK